MSEENLQKDEFSLEDALSEVKQIVQRMQKEINDFDEQISLFTRGNELIQSCQEYLDKAEWKVEQLIDGDLSNFTSDQE